MTSFMNVRANRPQCIPGVAAVQRSCPAQVFMASQTDADAQIGRLIAGLEQHGIAERTLVALSTDNGPEERAVFVNGAGNTGPFRVSHGSHDAVSSGFASLEECGQ